MIFYFIIHASNLYGFLFLFDTEKKKRRLQLAEATDISAQEANKLLSQAVNVTFTDVTECVNVSYQITTH